MKSTIDLAKQTGMVNGGYWEMDLNRLEAFRALCVAEEHKRLLGVGIAEPDPEAVKRFGPPTYTADQLAAARLQGAEEKHGGGCTYAGPGRGDCENAVGLPGHSIPGQHDGPDDTVDAYGKPNGWCWSCWKSRRIAELEEENAQLREQNDAVGKACAELEQALRGYHDNSIREDWPADVYDKAEQELAQERSKREPLSDDDIRSMCRHSWVFDTAKLWVRMAEAAHGIGEQG